MVPGVMIRLDLGVGRGFWGAASARSHRDPLDVPIECQMLLQAPSPGRWYEAGWGFSCSTPQQD